jgi:hypothetical protein
MRISVGPDLLRPICGVELRIGRRIAGPRQLRPSVTPFDAARGALAGQGETVFASSTRQMTLRWTGRMDRTDVGRGRRRSFEA